MPVTAMPVIAHPVVAVLTSSLRQKQRSLASTLLGYSFLSKIEGSQTTSRLAAEFLRSVISPQLPYTNQVAALIDAIKAVGEKLIATNHIELATDNIVRCVHYVIMETDLSRTTAAIRGLSVAAVSDDDDEMRQMNIHICQLLLLLLHVLRHHCNPS